MSVFAQIDGSSVVCTLSTPDDVAPDDAYEFLALNYGESFLYVPIDGITTTNDTTIGDGCTYDVANNIFISARPSDAHALDEHNKWVIARPVDVSHRGIPTEHPPVWDNDRQKWYIPNAVTVSKKDSSNTRGIFVLCKATQLFAGETISTIFPLMSADPPICFFGYGPYNSDGTAKEDMWELCPPDFVRGEVSSLWQATNLFRDFNADPTLDTGDNKSWHAISKFLYIFDGSPYFYVVHLELMNLAAGHPQYDNVWEHSEEFEQLTRRIPPARIANSMAELIRLIAEWDWAYHHLDSVEPMAKLSHDFFATVDMPQDVYDALIEGVDESPLARWLNGDTDAYALPDERSPIPLIVQEWIDEKVWDLRHRIEPAPFNVVTYNEEHYRL